MKTLVILVLCLAAVAVKAKNTGKAEDDHDHDHGMDWWESGVFYQIYPRSFMDSDASGEGDLKGIISKLPHLKDLGVTGTWLSPIFKSPMKDGGYDISDFYNVNERFGTNQDLKDLFTEAKKNDLKVILDFVPNHTSDQHEWFKLSRSRNETYENWYVWRSCKADRINETHYEITEYPNNWRAVFNTPAWSYDAVREECYLHQFAPEQPDLNYRHPPVRAAMIAMLEHWLIEGADGFRIDAINHMYESIGMPDETMIDPNGDVTQYENYYHTHTMDLDESYEFIYDVRKMMEEYSFKKDNITRLLMTEAYATIPKTALWYGNAEGTKKGAHIPFNFMLISSLSESSEAKDFHDAIKLWTDSMPSYGEANWVMGNHDRSRIGSRYGKERHEGLAIMTMMLPGTNIVYYGEEILMVDNCDISWEDTDDPSAKATNASVYKQVSRDPVRTPMQWDNTANAGFSTKTGKTWLPVNKDFTTNNLAAQKSAEKSTFKLYKDLIKMRKESHTLMMGGFYSKAVDTKVFGFVRTLAGHDSIAVLLNLDKTAKTVSLKDLFDEKEWKDDKMKAKILIVNNDSKLKINDDADPTKIELGPYDGVAIEVSSATQMAVSMLLIVASLLKFLF